MAYGGGNPYGQMDDDIRTEMIVENQKAKMLENNHKMVDVCWDKCVDKIPHKPDAKMDKCVKNCVERFLETNMFVVKKLGQMGNS